MLDYRELVRLAEQAREKAYAPYSGFKVGAAALMESGKVYTGANVENASFGATCCAERTAVFKAVSEGERRIRAVAVTGSGADFTFPCGICRQVIAEFSDVNTRLICADNKGEFREFTLKELLPNAFVSIK